MKQLMLTAIISVIVISVSAQDLSQLKLNPEKNIVYRFKSVTEQTLSQTVSGIQQNTSTQSKYISSIKMLDASPDFIIAEVRFDTIMTITNAMGVNYTINSATEGNLQSDDVGEVLSCIMNRLSNNALYVKIDYSGTVLEVVNAKMLSDIILKDTSSITGPLAPSLKAQIMNLASEDALGRMVELMFIKLPGKTVAKGEEWSISEDLNSGGMLLDIKTTYKLTDIKGNNASIDAESNINVSENAQPIRSGPALVSYDDLKGLSKSNTTLDIQTGLLNESTGKTHISGNLDVNAQGTNMQIPMEIDITSDVMILP